MIERKLGLYKSPESIRDWKVSTVLRAPTKLPRRVDLRQYCGPIRDQGETGFCHSFAGAALKDYQECKEKGWRNDLSPLYLARRVKQIDGYPGQEGSDLLSVMKALSDTGTIQETYYPFSGYKAGSLQFPTGGNGYQYKIKNYARCATIADMKTALSLGKPVLLGLQCTAEIYGVNAAEPVVPLPSKLVLIGGHAVAVLGYDDDYTYAGHTGHLLFQNSWGEDWGEGGFAWIPYDYINYQTKDTGAKPLFIDAYCSIDLENDNLTERVVKMKIGEKTVQVDGKDVAWDQPPVIDKDSSRTLVPLRNLAELAGYAVLWDEKTKEITMVREG
jgi:C1A family cysteine protease